MSGSCHMLASPSLKPYKISALTSILYYPNFLSSKFAKIFLFSFITICSGSLSINYCWSFQRVYGVKLTWTLKILQKPHHKTPITIPANRISQIDPRIKVDSIVKESHGDSCLHVIPYLKQISIPRASQITDAKYCVNLNDL